MPKNIILFMTDQHRSDYVGYLPGGKALTPNINRIASKAYFTRCTTANPICTPARTSLITGRYSRQIGMLTMSGDFFPQIPTFMQALQRAGYRTYGIGKYHYMHCGGFDKARGRGLDHVAMAEEMKAFGYDFVWETAGKQTGVPNYCFYTDYLNQKGLLNRYRDFVEESGGINGDTPDHNYDQTNPWPLAEEDYVDVVTARVAREQLAVHPREQPFYMYVSFCGPHKPYDAPQRYLDQFPLENPETLILPDGQTLTEEEKRTLCRQRRSYKAMIKLIDDQIGETLALLEKRDMLKDTLVLFTSDHGEMLGDHYRIQKGVPWEQASNVPLAAWLPDGPEIGAVPHPVQLFDVAATILDYAGLNPQEALSRAFPAYNDRIPSRSFLPILTGTCEKIRDWTYCESDFSEEHPENAAAKAEILAKRGAGGRRSNAWRMIVTTRGKYIKYIGYDEPGASHEEYYDLEKDPQETENRIGDPAYQAEITEARHRMEFVIDQFPTAQLTWTTKYAEQRVYH